MERVPGPVAGHPHRNLIAQRAQLGGQRAGTARLHPDLEGDLRRERVTRVLAGSCPAAGRFGGRFGLPGDVLQCHQQQPDQRPDAIVRLLLRVLRQAHPPATGHPRGGAGDLMQVGAVDHEFRGADPGKPRRFRRRRLRCAGRARRPVGGGGVFAVQRGRSRVQPRDQRQRSRIADRLAAGRHVRVRVRVCQGQRSARLGDAGGDRTEVAPQHPRRQFGRRGGAGLLAGLAGDSTARFIGG